MSDQDRNFTGSIPDVYDDLLVPLIFGSYAEDMAQRVASGAPLSVLETAAGSGVVTRALAPFLNEGASYTVTDLNPPMLARAKRQQPADDRIVWRQADAMALPFDEETFDAVCCQFGMMFLPDMTAGCREALRVLRDGGQFVFSVWDRIEENEIAHSVTTTATRHFPEDPPIFLARTPHGHHDADRIRLELQRSGFGAVDVHTITAQSRADSPETPAVAYCQGTPLRNELDTRDPTALEKVTKAAAADIERSFGSGPVSGKIQGHVFVASR